MLAALTLLGVTVWLARTTRARWVWLVTGLPTVFMYVMSVWALWQIMGQSYAAKGFSRDPILWVALVLMALAALMLWEAIRVLLRAGGPPPPGDTRTCYCRSSLSRSCRRRSPRTSARATSPRS